MADHRATWVRLRQIAGKRFLNDELATEIAAREAFDAEETTTYAADLDPTVEEPDVLETARVATSLREELRDEMREEGHGHDADEPSDGDNKVDNNEFIHLDDDDLVMTSSLDFWTKLKPRRLLLSRGR
jgi:hypothetical protein